MPNTLTVAAVPSKPSLLELFQRRKVRELSAQIHAVHNAISDTRPGLLTLDPLDDLIDQLVRIIEALHERKCTMLRSRTD